MNIPENFLEASVQKSGFLINKNTFQPLGATTSPSRIKEKQTFPEFIIRTAEKVNKIKVGEKGQDLQFLTLKRNQTFKNCLSGRVPILELP